MKAQSVVMTKFCCLTSEGICILQKSGKLVMLEVSVGKRSSTRMKKVKEAMMQMHPCEAREIKVNVWVTCCKDVDESCRRLDRN